MEVANVDGYVELLNVGDPVFANVAPALNLFVTVLPPDAIQGRGSSQT